MLRSSQTVKRNPYLFSIIVTIFAVLGLIIAKYVLGNKLDFIEILVFAFIFWVIFFFVQYWRKKFT